MSIISENAKRIAGANKRLGQNFILDINITRKIASFADVGPDDTVVEIGPGPGGLTLAILQQQPKALVVIEKDDRCLPGLEELVRLHKGTCAVDIIHGDALDVLASCGLIQNDKKLIIIANLPYNVAAPILIQFIHMHTHIKEMVLMFQKEMAQRIAAKPSTKAYGRLSIITQAFFTPTLVYHLPPSVFTPPPKVDSAVVRFEPVCHSRDLSGIDLAKTEKIIRSLEHITNIFFSSRRKTIGNIARKHFADAPKVQEFLQPYLTLRPENLDVEVYLKLAALI